MRSRHRRQAARAIGAADLLRAGRRDAVRMRGALSRLEVAASWPAPRATRRSLSRSSDAPRFAAGRTAAAASLRTDATGIGPWTDSRRRATREPPPAAAPAAQAPLEP